MMEDDAMPEIDIETHKKMMEDDVMSDIETPGDAVVQQQPEGRVKPSCKNVILIATGVALVAAVAIGVAFGTRMPDEGGSVQAAFLRMGENDTLFPTSTPPALRPQCPANVTTGDCFEEGATCADGKESCCGETFDSLVCDCEFGAWVCMATDACFAPACEEPTTEPVAPPSSCDYTVTNMMCDTDDDCTCGNVCLDSAFDDFSVCGCKVGTTNGCDPESDKSLCYTGYTASGVGCGCQDNDDCESGETCGTSWCLANIIPFCSADHNAMCPPTQSPASSFTGTSPPTANVTAGDPTPGPSIDPGKVNPPPTPAPTAAVTESPTVAVTTSPTSVGSPPTLEPTGNVTTSPTSVGSPPTLEPTENVTTSPTSVGSPPTPKPIDALVPPPAPASLHCVNVTFTSALKFPKDNGYTFSSKETGDVLFEQQTGSMSESQTAYSNGICNLPAGNYTLVVTDSGGDGLTSDGNGKYVVDIDDQVILVGGRFRSNKISHDIIVGFDANMSEKDKAFLDAHNSRRKTFHESQKVTFRPLAWSPELAAGASAWAKERVKTCSEGPVESGEFGQNIASQKLVSAANARPPNNIVGWWTNNFKATEPTWSRNLQQGSAVMWRTALYVGCAAEVARIENCDPVLNNTSTCYCQISNCR